MPGTLADPASLPLRVHPAEAPTSLLGALEPAELHRPLGDALADLCREAAALLHGEVVSVYGLERGPGGDDALVVLANVGFPDEVVGNLRLRIGDGIVGLVAEYLRPISLSHADRDPRYLAVRGIGEERLPVMLAQPIMRRGRLLGVLVVRRAADELGELERRVAALLADAAGLLLEGAARAPSPKARAATAITLDGEPVSGGCALGRVDLLPTAEALARGAPPRGGAPRDTGGEVERPTAGAIGEALARIERDLVRTRDDLGGTPEVARALGRLELLLADGRLRERVRLAGDDVHGLAGVARDYGRAPYLAGGAPDPASLSHAADVEELCVLIHVAAGGASLRRSGRVWMGQRLGAFFALAALRHAAAVVIDQGGAITDEARAIARAGRLPVVGGVAGLFAWTQPGDLLLVEADLGHVRVNPAAASLVAARVRRAR
jgi:phosphotransferase system enzyme I (PtsP)